MGHWAFERCWWFLPEVAPTTFLEAPKNIFFRPDLTELYEMAYVGLEQYPMLASLRGSIGTGVELKGLNAAPLHADSAPHHREA